MLIKKPAHILPSEITDPQVYAASAGIPEGCGCARCWCNDIGCRTGDVQVEDGAAAGTKLATYANIGMLSTRRMAKDLH